MRGEKEKSFFIASQASVCTPSVQAKRVAVVVRVREALNEEKRRKSSIHNREHYFLSEFFQILFLFLSFFFSLLIAAVKCISFMGMGLGKNFKGYIRRWWANFPSPATRLTLNFHGRNFQQTHTPHEHFLSFKAATSVCLPCPMCLSKLKGKFNEWKFFSQSNFIGSPH